MRGRGNSDGTFRPCLHESNDGYDVVEWLAQQSFCNGKVAMWGVSYLGYSQWATAKTSPPHLATIVPVAAPFMGVDFPMRNNIFNPFVVRWLALTGGRTSQIETFSDDAFWSAKFRDWHESGRPFYALDDMLGIVSPIFQEWLLHPEPDDYWARCNPTAPEYRQITIPILTITGSYDDDQPGALRHYSEHLRHASPEVRSRHYLIIGPWDHAGTRVPAQEFGGLKLGPASLIDMPKLHLDWYSWVLNDGPKPAFLRKHVAYYVMGAERWRYADSLDAITAKYHTYLLDSACNATDVFASGSLRDSPGTGHPDVYIYDPRNTSGPEVEAEAQADGNSLTDQSLTLALRGRQLVYHSAPFEHDTEVSGFFKLNAWISIDCPDTDFYVSVSEIDLDAHSIRLSTDALRARYREGLSNPKLIQSVEPLHYEFCRFTFVSRQIKRGHRLRLVIAPLGRLIGSTFTQKNYNGGSVVARESKEDGRPVTVRLFHDETHPSALYVPLGQMESDGEALAPADM